MDSHRWQRLKLILAEALEQESPAARTALVGRSCGNDADLLREIESLLAEAEPLLNETPDELEECANNFAAALPRKDTSEIGKRIGAYVIIREIGHGGMGTVCLAARADGYFEKQVAIKLLKREVVNEEVLRRFRSELEVLARLDHPNIARLIDAGTTDDGLPYFVMEYIDGIPITRFLDEKQEGLAARLNLFLKISAAVEAAHRNSVIHRDLKPNNILVNREGEPKLLDFGIAKFVGKNTNPLELTALGHERLTPVSASPEQAKGEPVTISSDIYGLGVILYEMLTGVRPHRFLTSDPSREDLVEVVCKQLPTLASLVVKNRERQRQLRGDLDAILVRALQKEPALRYPSVAEFADDIRRHLNGKPVRAREYEAAYRIKTRLLHNKNVQVSVGTAILALLFVAAFVFSSRVRSGLKQAILRQTHAHARNASPLSSESSIPEKSIAVLPFENLSEDKSNAFFADGVQDEILTDLARVADLKVISRTSVMQYRNAAVRNLREIGQQLGVAHVLEGTVQRAADKVRVNVQLINARTDAHEWAENYDRPINDVFAIQSEIAKTIAEQLQAHLLPSEKAAIAEAPTKDVVAYDLFVRAMALEDMVNDPGGKESLLQAVGLLGEAVRRDPKFLSAYCLLCAINLDLYWFGFDHTPARREQAHDALQAAERIQPDAGEVHVGKGMYAYHGFRDYDRARGEFELARKKLPNAAGLYASLGAVDRRQARWDDAIRNFDRAVQLDPRNFSNAEEAGFTYGGLGRNAEAVRFLKRAIELSPKDYFARIQLAENSYFEHADLGPLRAQLNIFLKEGSDATANAAQFFVLCALAERDRAAAEQALTFIPSEGTVSRNFLIPRDWFVGLVARSFGDGKEAQKAFTAARVIAAKTVQEQPDYAPAWSLLGMIDAGLGRKADAMAEGNRACEILPISKDSWEGQMYVTNLALIYAWLGEKDRALEQLAISAKSRMAGISYGELKLDPTWDSLRGDPSFEKIVASVAPKE
jgi:serine/threonine protein kinase/tetratricopeptide (TPR) repeat protein